MKLENLSDIKLEYRQQCLRLQKCFCIGPVQDMASNDYLNCDLGAIFKDGKVDLDNQGRIKTADGKTYTPFYQVKKVVGYEAIDFTQFDLQSDKIYIFSCVFCSKESNSIIRLGCQCKMKAWINGDIIMNSYIHGNDSYTVAYPLRKGNNFFVIEIGHYVDAYAPNRPASFSMRISDFDSEEDGINGRLFRDYIRCEVLGCADVVAETWDLRGKSYFAFSALPKDYLHMKLHQKYHVTVWNIEGNYLEEFDAEFGEKVIRNLEEFKGRTNCEVLTYLLEYQIDGIPHQVKKVVQLLDMTGKISGLSRRLTEGQQHHHLSGEDTLNVEARLQQLFTMHEYTVKERPIANVSMEDFLEYYREAETLLDYYDRDKNFGDYLYKEKYSTVFYRSKLDNTIEIYNICLPQTYESNRKYPLFIFLHLGRYCWDSKYLHRAYGDVPGIMVDATCRGYTMGSYVGEASLNEIIRLLESRFQIDRDRIYMIGSISGAFAAWSFAQAYPHLLAGVAVISGIPYYPNIGNLTNTNILLVSGEHESYFEDSFRKPEQFLKKHTAADFYPICIREADDNTLYCVGRSRFVQEWLLSHKRDDWPRKIQFRTERMKHNQCSWVKIGKIEPRKRFAAVQAEITDRDAIRLQLENIEVLSLQIPEYMLHRKITVSINGRAETVNDCPVALVLKKSFAGYNISAEGLQLVPKHIDNIGMGICGIYLDRVRVIVPSRFESQEERETLLKIADVLAHPTTQGWDLALYTDYPVLKETEANDAIYLENNIIRIAASSELETVRKLTKDMPLQLDEKGYMYNGRHYVGAYCAVTIFPSPVNREKNTLLVYGNQYSLMKKCFFIRKMILTTYMNGLHPYNNAEAILYNGRRYSVIYSFEEEPVEY